MGVGKKPTCQHLLRAGEPWPRDAANGALADAQATVLRKAGLLSMAYESIKDQKQKLEGLEGTLSEAKAR